MSQVASGMASMSIVGGGTGPDVRNHKNLYNQKFGQANKSGHDVKSTPQTMISSKIGMKPGA